MEGAIRRDFGKDAAQRRQNILRFDATHRREENRRRRTQKARGRGDEKRLLFLSRKVHHSLGDLPAPVGDIYIPNNKHSNTQLYCIMSVSTTLVKIKKVIISRYIFKAFLYSWDFF